MATTHNPFLLVAAGLSALAALLHLGCIAAGPAGYRFLGAGEGMAQMSSNGHWYPTAITLVIASILFVWSLYALSGAGVSSATFTPLVLLAITGVYLLRGLAFLPLMAHFTGNSMTFWYASSAICLAFGIVHAIGLRQVWSRL